MEGGLLSWKVQKIDNPCPSMDAISKPLPNPPTGCRWERRPDGSWVLTRVIDDRSQDEDRVVFDEPRVVEHTVMPNDTLTGICLQYGIKAATLRRFNIFSGNNIQALKIVKIPVEAGVPVYYQSNTESVLIQKFRNATGQGSAEARVYLEDGNWDLKAALEIYRSDESWVASHPAPISEDLDEIESNEPTSLRHRSGRVHPAKNASNIRQVNLNNNLSVDVVPAARVEVVSEVVPLAVTEVDPSVFRHTLSASNTIEMTCFGSGYNGNIINNNDMYRRNPDDDPSMQPLLSRDL